MNPLLKNLGAKLRQMMAEDWRGEDERNTLGMAGHLLEKLAEDAPKRYTSAGATRRQTSSAESCQCVDQAAVYRDDVPWCINCSARIILHNNQPQP